MDQQRIEAYWNLIQALVDCESGQEKAVLTANSELIDLGLVQAMEAVAEMMSQQGDQNAQWLQNLAATIAQMLENSSPSTTAEDYGSFVQELLLAANKSDVDSEAIDQVLRRNLKKLDENFAQIFPQMVTALIAAKLEGMSIVALAINISNSIQAFPLGERANNLEIAIAGYEIVLSTHEANIEEWAMTQNNLGIAYSERILGEKANNLEKAIACHQQALIVHTRERFPVQWAMTQNNLGTAYRERILGKRANNLESAIACFQQALMIRTRESLPFDWAGTQNNLGLTYNDRILGERANNLESAINYYQQALIVFTRESFPFDWAMTQNNLGNAYSNRILGERANNLETAIACYQQALMIRTSESFPFDWAMTQNNLGVAYSDRILGERANNLESAIAYYQKALIIRTCGSFPVEWAQTQNNLGAAYSDRILGERANNFEKAINCYQQALIIYTRESFPFDWAMTQNNLGLAYNERILGERAENLESALACHKQALIIYTRESFPFDWAMTQNNLGNAYSNRILGERAENLESALACHKQALIFHTHESFPFDWAMTQHNLGLAYNERILGEITNNLESAIVCFQNALQVRTPTAFPLDCLLTGDNLGNTAFTLGNWELAIQGYGNAIDAVEQSRTWATNEERRQEILAESIDVYEKMVQACINNEQLDKAIEYAERSRSQRLVDLMASNDLYAGGDILPEVQLYLQQFEAKQRQIDQLRRVEDIGRERETVEANRSRAKLAEKNVKIQALETELQKIWQQIRKLDPVLSGEIKVAAPNLAAMQQLVDDDKTAILSFYSTFEDTYIFVLQKNHISCHRCQGQGRKEMQSVWIFENWLQPYVFNKPEWRSKIGFVLGELATRLRLDDLIAEHLEGIEELVIVPHLYLHQIPFAALPIAPPQPPLTRGEQDQESKFPVPPLFKGGLGGVLLTQDKTQWVLGDQFLIRYVPSCQILEYCQNRPSVETPLEYGTVEDATEDLPYASFEGEQVAQLYQIPDHRRHRGLKGATVANYRKLAKQVQGIVSSHHAQSRLDNPLQSELLLADGSITLGELLTPGWRLPQLVDVFLSCCETGLGLPEALTDDYFTLSFGFLCAGARSVVSTLWAVDDLATALFSLFYHRHKQNLSRPAALRKAQADLRTLTGETLATKYKPLLLPSLEKRRQQIEAAVEQADSALDKAISKTDKDYWEDKYYRTSKTLEKVETTLKLLDNACKKPSPFSDYFYWSAFTCQGLR